MEKTFKQRGAFWKPISEKFDGSKYEEFTLVKISGWCRPGFAVWRARRGQGKGIVVYRNDEFWDLTIDPAAAKPKNNTVLYWLAVPKMKA
jgi:hypothetical protein